MHLLGCEPSHAPQVRIQLREPLCDRMRELNADEEPFRPHCSRLSSQPDRAESPSGPVGGGSSTVSIIFIVLPAMFGKSAFPRIVARAKSGIVSDGKPRREAEMIWAAARSAFMDAKGRAVDKENQVNSAW